MRLSSTNKQQRLRQQRLLWAGISHGKHPCELAQLERERKADPQSIQLATKVHPSKYTLQMVETKEIILTSHKVKLLGHRTRPKEQHTHFNSFS